MGMLERRQVDDGEVGKYGCAVSTVSSEFVSRAVQLTG